MFIKTMKLTLAIGFSILAFAATSLKAQVCQPAPVGLAHWWAADGNALDSRSRNNGTLQNGAGFTIGQNGQAFNFDGDGDSIQVPHSANLNISGSFTAEAWILPRTLQNIAPRIFDKDNGAGGSFWQLSVTNDGTFINALGFSGGGGVFLTTPNNSITLNQWHHVAVAIGAGGTKLYINGIERASSPQTALSNNSSPLLIGNDFTGTRDFDGLIDESAVYDRALSAQEIAAIHAAGQAGKCKPTATVSPTGQIAWFAGDGNSNDSAGTNNGTLQPGAGFAIGKVGQSFVFNNTPGVTAPDNAAFNQSTLTLEAWVTAAPYTCNPPGNCQAFIIAKSGSNGLFGYEFGVREQGRLRFSLNGTAGGADVIGNVSVNDGNFHHVVGSYDGATMKIFVDGVLDAQTSVATAVNYQANSPLHIGSRQFSSVALFPYPGKIDEVSIYNRPLTEAEITSIFNAGIAGKLKQNATIDTGSLISLWQGEGSANDTRGANSGTFAANTYAPGKVGQAFSLDGADDSANLGSMPTLQNFSLEAWVNPLSAVNDPINQELIVGQSHVGQIVVRKIGGVDRPVFQFRDSSGANFQQVVGTTELPLNSWTHLAGTYDGSTLRLYVNGALNAQATPTNTAVFSCSSPYFIGGFPTGTHCDITAAAFQFLNGLVDEAAVYNRALTAAEVRANYEAGNALSTVVGDVRVSFPSVTTTGLTQEIPLEESDLPALPAGMTSTGLFYDIATSAMPTGSTDLCFNLQAFAGLTNAEFNERRVLHLENNQWATNRTLSWNFSTKTICARVPSLSPFAIVDSNLLPTAASVSIGGRARRANGKGIALVRVSLTDSSGSTRTTITDLFGKYRFDDVPAGATYIISVSHRRIQFIQNTQVRFIGEDDFGIEFVAIE